MPKVFAVDGNIGVGKSTLLRELKSRGYTVFEEPIDIWYPLLKFCQQDMAKWTYILQVTILSHYLKLQDIIKTLNIPVVFIERCALANKAFTYVAHENKTLTDIEFNILEEIYKLNTLIPDKTFLLKCSSATCLNRIKTRNRQGEEFMTIQYLDQIHKYYDMLFKDYNVVHIDCEASPEVVLSNILNYM
uniref:Putative deoxynucleoside kinase n=1 Tax=Rhinella marina erythrocytic-like virus TaxID=2859906 RepID=A0A8F6UAD4_9VIRU|nr:putative deoxynucleoside kinase [Rhinella marina erythrocytic-like virus]